MGLLVMFSSHGNSSVALADRAGPVRWSSPLNLSDTPTMSDTPYLVSDRYGFVHAFWVEDYDGPRFDRSSKQANTIFYSRWDGTSWSNPVDLFVASGNAFSQPVAAISEDSRLYLFWLGWDGIHFSSASAYGASSAKAWSKEQVVATATGYRPAVAALHTGEVYLVYSALQQAGSKDGNIYVMKSSDNGESWSAPVQISQIDPEVATLAVFPHLVVDGRGRLHVAWYETDPPNYVGTAVFYSRSLDGGQSWDRPLKVAESSGESTWASAVQVVTRQDDQVYITWVCGKSPGRCSQRSTDGGSSWQPSQHLFGSLHSLAAWDAVTVDEASGAVYWVLQLRYPEGLYYTYLDGDQWVDPPFLVDDGPLIRGHGPSVAVVRGNQLQIAASVPESGDVWAISGVNLAVAAQQAQPMPTEYPTPIAFSTITATAAPAATPTKLPNTIESTVDPALNQQRVWGFGFWMSFIPTMLLIGTVVILRRVRSFR